MISNQIIIKDGKQVSSRELPHLLLPTTSSLAQTDTEETWGKSLYWFLGILSWVGVVHRRGKMSRVLIVRELVTHWWPQALGQPYIAKCQPLL